MENPTVTPLVPNKGLEVLTAGVNQMSFFGMTRLNGPRCERTRLDRATDPQSMCCMT